MIEKKMHFIWIGQRIPEYGRRNIDAFYHMNPAFECNVIHIQYTNCINNDEYNEIWQQVNKSYGKYLPMIDYYRKLGRHANQIFSNILRYDILNKHGGIYLDLDCIPCNPFDDEILLHDFVVSRNYTKSCIRRDCYFLGKSSTTDSIASYMDKTLIEVFDPNYDRMKMLKLRRYMKNGQTFDCRSNFYFVHANMEEWKKW